MFTDTNKQNREKIKAPDSHFSCEELIRLCDNNAIVYKAGVPSTECDVAEVCFFFRTFKQNLVVINDTTGDLLFNVVHDVPDGMSLNDYMLMSARDLLMHIYEVRNDIRPLAFHCMPTPFGLTEYRNHNITVFQVCVDKENLPPLKTPYVYVGIEDLTDNSELAQRVKNQFKRTEE